MQDSKNVSPQATNEVYEVTNNRSHLLYV